MPVVLTKTKQKNVPHAASPEIGIARFMARELNANYSSENLYVPGHPSSVCRGTKLGGDTRARL